MTLARLLAAALLVCSLSAFGQDSPKGNRAPSVFFRLPGVDLAATATEPWRIIPNKPDGRSSILNQSDINWLPAVQSRETTGWEDDEFCYAIRSYVVARDSKDSDSTHPVSSSTCRPANRYHVKSADIHQDSSER